MSYRRAVGLGWRLVFAPLLGMLFLLFGLSVWLLIEYQTIAGLALANIGLWSGIGVVSMLVGWGRRWSAVLGLVVAVWWVVWLGQAPTGQPAADSPITHQFVGDGRTFPRWSLVNNLIPEAEQMSLGFRLMPYVDALFTTEQAAELRPATAALYQQIGQDPHFSELGSSMGWAYPEIIGQPFDVGHYYLYIPARAEGDEPLPALLFLHGSGGNFLPYTWILAKVAEQEGLVVIAPSFGFGNWRRPGGTTAALRALADAQTKANIDPERIYLMGLSNGGLGVSLAGNEAAEQFAGLIFVSPVMANEVVDSPEFQAQWYGRPVLVITGEKDDRVPVGYVRQRVAGMAAGGVVVTSHIYPSQDHFLFFYEEERLRADLVAWLGQPP